jgi:hypothetical protein
MTVDYPNNNNNSSNNSNNNNSNNNNFASIVKRHLCGEGTAA